MVFVRNPKVASRSISEWLMNHHGFVLQNDNDCYWGKHHSTRIPRAWKTYAVIAAVRNPYARLVSAWSYASKPDMSHWWDHMLSKEQWPFDKFLRWTVDPCLPPSNLPRFPQQAAYLAQLNVAHLLRFESLADDLAKLPLTGDAGSLPHLYRGSYGAWKEHFNARLLAIARPYVMADCQLYGYRIKT
jgi:hypothetical protein